MKTMNPIESNMTDIIKEKLHALGYTETEGKEQRELKTILAVLEIKAESPHNTWF